MSTHNLTQVAFFESLKTAIPSYASIVDVVSETLDISIDSAYRRIRGQKLLDFSELVLLSNKFNISLDQVFGNQSDTVLFHANQNDFNDQGNFKSWMEDVLAQLEMVSSFNEKHIYFLLKDMPPWYHYYYPELAAFKFFFWQKSILFNDNLKDKRFSVSNQDYAHLEQVKQKILRTSTKIPTTEIWNLEGMNTTLRQIDLYHEMGIMSSSKDTAKLYECVIQVVDHLEKMAEYGKKFMPGTLPDSDSADYNFYVNDFVLGDNTFFVQLNDTKVTYLNYSVIYFMGTSDPSFNEGMFRNLENLIKKSTLISKTGEKDRRQFFNKLRRKTQTRLDSLYEAI
ncbi:hypothetical protein [Algoriphagus sediminis]|uniref:Transcription regulator BetR N-terminal domain-containing protein n=1 Tax=Algoriphagus sediminis TaxID=3057113 RepID=A0ABT7YAU2_9BACT|nr:hypothetical protein [Algoriphagus sediminis]MDN3203645.1 hypothetical protein [Algoriphagus sediminis]